MGQAEPDDEAAVGAATAELEVIDGATGVVDGLVTDAWVGPAGEEAPPQAASTSAAAATRVAAERLTASRCP